METIELLPANGTNPLDIGNRQVLINGAVNNVLHVAVSHNDVELVAALLKKGAKPNLKNQQGQTALDIANQKLFTDIIRLFKVHNEEFLKWCEQPPYNERDPFGFTKLMKACDMGDEKAVNFLLQKDVDVNAMSQNGLTALMIAAYYGHVILVSQLLVKGADVNAASKQGNKALDIARKKNYPQIVKILQPLTFDRIPEGIKKMPSEGKLQSSSSFVAQSSIRIRKLNSVATLRNRGTVAIDPAQSEVEVSIDAHLTNLDELVKFNTSTPNDNELDLSKMIDLPAEPILGPSITDANSSNRPAPVVIPVPNGHHRPSLSNAQRPRLDSILKGAYNAQQIREQILQPPSPATNSVPSNPPTITLPSNFSIPTSSSTSSSSSTTPVPSSPRLFTADKEVEMNQHFLQTTQETIEKMEDDDRFSTMKQTNLNFIYQSLLGVVKQLITAVNNKFNGQFVDLNASIVNEISELTGEVKETLKAHDASKKEETSDFTNRREKSAQQLKLIDQHMQNLALKTKMASGVWPPKNSDIEMVEAAITLVKTVRDFVLTCNSLGLFKTEVDIEEKDPSAKRLDYKEYKRQRNMKLLEEIAQVEKSKILNEDEDVELDEEIKRQDNAFLEDLEASVKAFVGSIIVFKSSKEKGDKAEYIPTANKVVDEATTIGKKVDNKMSELTDIDVETNVYKLKTTIHSQVFAIGTMCSEFLTKVNLAKGVWPPPDAEVQMMDAALQVAASVKELVKFTKTAVMEYQETWKAHKKQQVRVKKDWEKKLMQVNKIEKFDVLVQEEHNQFLQFEQGEVELTQEEDELLRDTDSSNLIFESAAAAAAAAIRANADPNAPPSDKPVVKGGSVEKLTERLTYFKYPDPEYRLAFLLTYQSFTTPLKLFQLLVAKFEEGPPPGLNEAEFKTYLEKKTKPTRLRVFNVFKAWIENHFEDWADNSELISEFRKFVEQKMAIEMKSAAQQLMKSLRDRLDGLKRQTTLTIGENSEMPRSLLPKSCKTSEDLRKFLKNEDSRNWMKIDPLEMARQVTILEFSMYEKIQAKECIGQAWNGKKKHLLAPNISNCIAFTNQISSWVATKILDSEDIRIRVATVKYFVQIAQHCLELNNFNSATAIHAALESGPVHRLKKTWEQFNDKKNKNLITVYENMTVLFSPKGNSSNYRKHLHTINPPVVPYLGVYLTDLTFIEDGNNDFLPAPNNHLINFDKRKKISKSITEIKMYQQIPYFFNDVTEIQDFLYSVKGLDEKTLYSRSLVVEPKEIS